MKTNIIIILVIASLTYALTLYLGRNNIAQKITQVPDTPSIQKPIKDAPTAPDFDFTTIDGTSYKFSDLKGKIIILNFWASWCAPCIKEFPDLIKIAKDNKENIILLALSSDMDEESIQKFIDKIQTQQNIKIDAPNILIAHDKNQKITAGQFQTFKLPETIIIDRNLKMRHKLIGADWETDDITKIIDELK